MDFKDLLVSLGVILNEMSPYILLGFIVAGLLHVFVNRRTMARHLRGGLFGPVVKAALFGIPLPLCSCGVLPAAVSLRRQGASSAASTSFLIATPQTGVDSIAATYSLLGLPFAIIRPVAALVGAVFGGVAVGKLGEKDIADSCEVATVSEEDFSRLTFMQKVVAAVRYGLTDMVASIGKWLVIGLVVAALITVFVPDSFFLGLSRYPLLAMLAMVAVAVPMYICATGSIPIALSLMMKGLSPGVAFVLLMAGPAANFASVMVLRRSLGVRSTVIYIASVVLTAIIFGLIIDNALPSEWFVPPHTVAHGHGCHAEVTFGIFPSICSVLLVGLLIRAAIVGSHHSHIINKEDMKKVYKITGMSCAHCKANVERQVAGIEGVEAYEVNLSAGTLTVTGNADPTRVLEAVRAAGYEIEPVV